MLKNAFNLKFEIEGFFTSIYNKAIDRCTIAVWFYPRSMSSVLSGYVLYSEGLIRNVSTSFFSVEISS